VKVDIAPSVLSFSHANLKQDLIAMEQAGVGSIHLDVMDGQFVPPISFGDGLVKSVHSLISLPLEVHLMTINPERQIEAFAAAGCSRLIFHEEATVHSHRMVQLIHASGMEAGIAINPGTATSNLEVMANLVELVLIMTVNPGFGGQKFLPEMVEKIKTVRSWNPNVIVEVDGGIIPQTIKIAQAAGANKFVVGSFLQQTSSIKQSIDQLEAACS